MGSCCSCGKKLKKVLFDEALTNQTFLEERRKANQENESAGVIFYAPVDRDRKFFIFILLKFLPLLRPRKRARQTFYTERRSNLKGNLADSIGDNILIEIMDSAWPVVKRNVKNIHHIDKFRLEKQTLAFPLIIFK